MPRLGDRHFLQTTLLSCRDYLLLRHITLSFRDIQTMMMYRDIEVIYEPIRKWRWKLAQVYAN